MTQPLDFFRYRGRSLSAGKTDLAEIAAEVGTPAYVYSAEGFLKPFRELQKGLGPIRESTVCYAVKSNSNIAVLKLLAGAGAGADLVSGGELFRAKTAGIAPEKIVFSGVGKTADEIRAGLSYGPRGIYSFHVESLDELQLIQSVARTHGTTAARVAFRFNPNIDAKTHPYISTGLKRNKFGLNREELLEAARRARTMDSVRVCGLSIHIGSQLLSLKPLKAAFEALAKMVVEIEEVLGHALEFVDLGGGVGVSYDLRGTKPPSLKEYTRLIVANFGPKSKFRSRFRVLIEPGRTISANAGVLLTQVLFRKSRKQRDFLIVDAGMNDLMRPALYGSRHEVLPVKQASTRGKLKPTNLVGPVCESSDCFGQDLRLHEKLASGDLLAILSSGAYGMTMAGNYNSRVRPAEILVDANGWRVIRDRENLEDLLRGEHL
jgi:diaminopimelate decarboxylase